jgi:transcriptional regulator with XRE-family HTH domain
MGDIGQKLKQIRERLGLKYRDVEELSTRLAAAKGNDEFVVALSRLSDIENRGTLPTMYRLYSLCAIYRLDLQEVLSWYGITPPSLPADAAMIEHARTHVVGFQTTEGDVQVPIALDPGIDLTKTTFLSRLIQKWGRIPLLLLNHRDLRTMRYGLIGTSDWSMFPILRPGALVVIDDSRRRVQNTGWTNEHDRPIYFLEHREGYACCWCTVRDGRLTLHPHPSSQCEPESFNYPEEIEVVGQVTAVAMSIDAGDMRRPNSGS